MKRASKRDTKRFGKSKKPTVTLTHVTYSAFHRKLVLGDGDFTFSWGLVQHMQERLVSLEQRINQDKQLPKKKQRHQNDALGAPLRLVATSLDSREQVCEKYENAGEVLGQLKSVAARDVTVAHGVDATQLADSLRNQKVPSQGKDAFDRIIWNFPHSGQQRVHVNRELLSSFFRSAPSCLATGGQIHVTVKLKPPYSNWGIIELGEESGLSFMGSLVFDPAEFPGYAHRTTDPTAKDVEIELIRTHVFMVPKSKDSKHTAKVVNGDASAAAADAKDEQQTVSPAAGQLSKTQLRNRKKKMKKKGEQKAALQHHDQVLKEAAALAERRFSFFDSLDIPGLRDTRTITNDDDGGNQLSAEQEEEDGDDGDTEWLREELDVLERSFGGGETKTVPAMTGSSDGGLETKTATTKKRKKQKKQKHGDSPMEHTNRTEERTSVGVLSETVDTSSANGETLKSKKKKRKKKHEQQQQQQQQEQEQEQKQQERPTTATVKRPRAEESTQTQRQRGSTVEDDNGVGGETDRKRKKKKKKKKEIRTRAGAGAGAGAAATGIV